jgi:hypothetical protein
VLDGDEDEDPSFAISNAFEEDFHRVAKVACLKTKGRREMLNLKSSINYGNASASSREGKARLTCCSVESIKYLICLNRYYVDGCNIGVAKCLHIW